MSRVSRNDSDIPLLNENLLGFALSVYDLAKRNNSGKTNHDSIMPMFGRGTLKEPVPRIMSMTQTSEAGLLESKNAYWKGRR